MSPSHQQRICFRIPADFLLCVNADNEIAAWSELRQWLDKHAVFRRNEEGDRIPQKDWSIIEAGLEDSPGTASVSLNIHCHEITIGARTVPPDEQ